VSFQEAAALCAGMLTAMPFVRDKAKLQPGQRILINGASGSVGSAAVQLAKYYAAEVTGVCSTAHLALVKSLGADQVIDYTQQDFTQLGQTFDVVFDAAGVSGFERCRRLLKPQGIFLETAPSPRIFYDMLRTARSRGQKAIIMFTGLRPAAYKAKDLRWLEPLVEAGKLRAIIDRRFAMEQIVEAHRYVQMRHKQGNVVLDIAQP
jgi:NADPH:quinone reductase-like Zn-dependent oxidoreductase